MYSCAESHYRTRCMMDRISAVTCMATLPPRHHMFAQLPDPPALHDGTQHKASCADAPLLCAVCPSVWNGWGEAKHVNSLRMAPMSMQNNHLLQLRARQLPSRQRAAAHAVHWRRQRTCRRRTTRRPLVVTYVRDIRERAQARELDREGGDRWPGVATRGVGDAAGRGEHAAARRVRRSGVHLLPQVRTGTGFACEMCVSVPGL